MKSSVHVQTRLEIRVNEKMPYRVRIDVEALPNTDEAFLDRNPEGIHHYFDFETLPEAVKCHTAMNEELGLPEPIPLSGKEYLR